MGVRCAHCASLESAAITAYLWSHKSVQWEWFGWQLERTIYNSDIFTATQTARFGRKRIIDPAVVDAKCPRGNNATRQPGTHPTSLSLRSRKPERTAFVGRFPIRVQWTITSLNDGLVDAAGVSGGICSAIHSNASTAMNRWDDPHASAPLTGC